MKYDDASWHYGADNYPTDLSEDGGYMHIAMFMGWVFVNDMAGGFHIEEFSGDIEALKNRKVTALELLISYDGKLTDEDFNDEANKFAHHYYENGSYMDDYSNLFRELPSAYHVENTWDNFDVVIKMIDKAYISWKNPKKWYEFWK